jgi:selenocysteine lyase/cysteine desulfurase
MLERLVPSEPDHHGADLVAGDRFEWADGARRFEYWEHNVAGWLGLGAAVDHALDRGIDRIEVTVAKQAELLRSMLTDIGLTVHDEGVERRSLPELLRLSVHYTTTDEELAAAVEVLGR